MAPTEPGRWQPWELPVMGASCHVGDIRTRLCCTTYIRFISLSDLVCSHDGVRISWRQTKVHNLVMLGLDTSLRKSASSSEASKLAARSLI